MFDAVAVVYKYYRDNYLSRIAYFRTFMTIFMTLNVNILTIFIVSDLIKKIEILDNLLISLVLSALICFYLFIKYLKEKQLVRRKIKNNRLTKILVILYFLMSYILFLFSFRLNKYFYYTSN